MKKRKRKLTQNEILGLAESDSERNVLPESEMTLNVYFGTEDSVLNVEKPKAFDLLVFPSSKFRDEMLKYNEIRCAKRVCLSLTMLK